MQNFIYDFKTEDDDSEAVSRLNSHFDVKGYRCLDIFYEKQTLIDKLIDLLHSKNDDVLFKSAQLLFDLYKRELILFNDAANSFLVTHTSVEIQDEWVEYGSFTDKYKLLLKTHKGTLEEESMKEEVLELLDEWAENCFLKDDDHDTKTAEPNPCLQGIAYSSSKLISILLIDNVVYPHTQDYSVKC